LSLEDLCRDNYVQLVLSGLMKGKLKEIDEQLESKTSIVYPKAHEVLGLDAEATHLTLNRLVEAGVLAKERARSVYACPNCSSVSIRPSLLCPSCNSDEIAKVDLIEHLTCGHVAAVDEFTQAERYVCPKCRKELKTIGVDYRRNRGAYACSNCRGRFTTVIEKWVCNACERAVSAEELQRKDLYRYTINEGRRSELASLLFDLSPIAEFFRGAGYHVEERPTIFGLSGAEHRYDLICVKERDKGAVVRLIVAPKEVGVEQVAALYAEVIDSPIFRKGLRRPRNVIAVCVPEAGRDALRQARLLNITCISARTPDECLEKLRAEPWEKREMKYPQLLM